MLPSDIDPVVLAGGRGRALHGRARGEFSVRAQHSWQTGAPSRRSAARPPSVPQKKEVGVLGVRVTRVRRRRPRGALPLSSEGRNPPATARLLIEVLKAG